MHVVLIAIGYGPVNLMPEFDNFVGGGAGIGFGHGGFLRGRLAIFGYLGHDHILPADRTTHFPARAVLAYGFGELGLHRVHARHFVGNEESGRVLRKVGMTREGIQRHGIRKAGTFRDLVLYGVVKD